MRLAREGVDIIGVDICADIVTMDYPNATPADPLGMALKGLTIADLPYRA